LCPIQPPERFGQFWLFIEGKPAKTGICVNKAIFDLKRRSSMKINTLLISGAMALSVLAGPAAQAKDWKTVTITLEGAYAPWNLTNADGTLGGFEPELAKSLCDQMKIECKLVASDWDGMIPGLMAKKYDAIVASMSITAERKQKIDFTGKYYNTPAVIVARKDSKIKIGADGHIDPASMKGLKIGAQRATIHENFARANFPGAEVVVYDTADNANLDLMSGRLDARIDDILALEAGILKQDGGADYQIFGKGWTGGILGDGAGIGVRKEDTRLRDTLSQAILDIRADGTYKKINDKYFNFDVYGD